MAELYNELYFVTRARKLKCIFRPVELGPPTFMMIQLSQVGQIDFENKLKNVIITIYLNIFSFSFFVHKIRYKPIKHGRRGATAFHVWIGVHTTAAVDSISTCKNELY